MGRCEVGEKHFPQITEVIPKSEKGINYLQEKK